MSLTTPSYGSLIPLSPLKNGDIHNPDDVPLANKKSFRGWGSMAAVIGLALFVGILVLFHDSMRLRQVQATGSLTPYSDPKTIRTSLPMPDGVNIGSWLSLEDYFFAGQSAIEVATPDSATAAVCLPPLHTGASTGPTWHAETDLLQNLAAQTTLGHAIRTFHAHRNTFLDFEEDLAVLKELGIHSIRVPISWCLTDEDPATIDPKLMDVSILEEQFTCRDPFYDGILWPASKFLVNTMLSLYWRLVLRHAICIMRNLPFTN